MNLAAFKKQRLLPDKPGVYMFIGRGNEILYIGKATSLRDRVRSYFDKDIITTRGPHIALMLSQARDVNIIATDSVIEALILEVNLIKKHQPRFNTKEKDDKSFNYVVITREDFPRVILVRAKELFGGEDFRYKVKYTFGLFPQGGVLKDALKIVRKIFPFRDGCLPAAGRPCFNRQIGLCPGVCTGEVSRREYAKTIQRIKLFFEGKKSTLLKRLQKEMDTAARGLHFERAAKIKKTIFALKHIQDIALIKAETEHQASNIKRIEAYDVAHISGRFAVGVMTVVKNGEAARSEYRKFKIKSFEGADDTRALTEVLERRLAHTEWQLPELFVVDGGKAQKNATEKVLKEAGVMIPVIGVVKDERHRPKEMTGKRDLVEKHEKEILLANNEAHRFAIAYHRQLRDRVALHS